ncbi:MAG TPA: hypothetical protein VJ552_11115 [Sediminibacterium sp.]|nr:hypothetical protein [Sediminibacterium sp.]
MDELKKYIQTNRTQLDSDEPAPKLLQEILAKVEPAPQKSVPVIRLIRRVAAACILALAGVGLWTILQQDQPQLPGKNESLAQNNRKPAPAIKATLPEARPASLAGNTNKQPNSSPLQHSPEMSKAAAASPEKGSINNMAAFRNIQAGFIQVINLQKARINTIPMYAESADYFKDFSIEIRQMEKEEKIILSAISRRGINNDLLDQLINLYQQKLTILKQLQLEMNKTNNRYKQNRGPVDTARTYFISI